MSIAVKLSELGDAVAKFRFAYLLTVSDDNRAHALAVQPVLAGDRIEVAGFGQRTRANAAARPAVTLLWPPVDIDGYSLIVDGESVLVDDALSVSPTRAVLHRPAPNPRTGSACLADCVELPVTGDERGR
ncbi:MAG: hypothetical protein L0H19_06935 [Salinisphaera sp.]|nr:hypothetical protein [Salinisphaera sp.]